MELFFFWIPENVLFNYLMNKSEKVLLIKDKKKLILLENKRNKKEMVQSVLFKESVIQFSLPMYKI